MFVTIFFRDWLTNFYETLIPSGNGGPAHSTFLNIPNPCHITKPYYLPVVLMYSYFFISVVQKLE